MHSTNFGIKKFVCSTAQKMKFSIKDFFTKCDQIRSFLRILSHLLKKSLMENFIFCGLQFVYATQCDYHILKNISWKILFFGDFVVNGILGRNKLWIPFGLILVTGFKEFIPQALFGFFQIFKKLIFKVADINNI